MENFFGPFSSLTFWRFQDVGGGVHFCLVLFFFLVVVGVDKLSVFFFFFL